MPVDPRLAALVRLLARDLAARHLAQQTCEEELQADQAGGYGLDPPLKETP
jgi:hypothetical protein